MNIKSAISFLLLSLLIIVSKSAECPSSKPYRCGSSWSDADTKCGQCCYSKDDCTTSGDNCYANVDPTPCQGTEPSSPNTPSPITPSPNTPTPITPAPNTPAPTSVTPITPSPNTPAPITPSPITPAPITPAPSTPAPNTPAQCNTRCGAGWSDANQKCGECCPGGWDSCSTSGENCFGGLDITPCVPSPTPKPTAPTQPPVSVPTADTPSPIVGNDIGNYRLATISGCGTGKFVSLTFDDGPAEQNDATLTIINTLNQHGIVATFYVSPAAWGEDEWGLDKRCELIQKLTTSGNEIQSHSWTHPNFKDDALTQQEIKYELDTASDFIVDCGGTAPTIFRPPYGALSKSQAEYIVSDLRYIIGLWNLDSNDWRAPNDFSQISTNIDLNKYQDDSINILMHDRSIYDIVDDIINKFNGYEFITQSECYQRCDTIDSDGVCMDTHGNNLYIINEWR